MVRFLTSCLHFAFENFILIIDLLTVHMINLISTEKPKELQTIHDMSTNTYAQHLLSSQDLLSKEDLSFGYGLFQQFPHSLSWRANYSVNCKPIKTLNTSYRNTHAR